MCLYLEKESQLLTAEEDIIVYKHLRPILKVDEKLHGKAFIGSIKDQKVEGTICVKRDGLFLCQNEFDGRDCINKFGYAFSWVFDSHVSYFVVAKKKYYIEKDFMVSEGYMTPYQEFEVCIGETYYSLLSRCEDTVEEGLHTYEDPPEGEFVAECIIPKGAEYYKGVFGGKVSYASDTLKYVRLL